MYICSKVELNEDYWNESILYPSIINFKGNWVNAKVFNRLEYFEIILIKLKCPMSGKANL